MSPTVVAPNFDGHSLGCPSRNGSTRCGPSHGSPKLSSFRFEWRVVTEKPFTDEASAEPSTYVKQRSDSVPQYTA